MRALLGGLSLLFFFLAIGLGIWAVVDGRNAAVWAVVAFVALLIAYFSRQFARRYQ